MCWVLTKYFRNELMLWPVVTLREQISTLKLVFTFDIIMTHFLRVLTAKNLSHSSYVPKSSNKNIRNKTSDYPSDQWPHLIWWLPNCCWDISYHSAIIFRAVKSLLKEGNECHLIFTVTHDFIRDSLMVWVLYLLQILYFKGLLTRL